MKASLTTAPMRRAQPSRPPTRRRSRAQQLPETASGDPTARRLSRRGTAGQPSRPAAELTPNWLICPCHRYWHLTAEKCKYSAGICANCNQLITDCSLHSVIIACRRPIVKDSLTAARLLSRANEPSFLSLNRPRRTSSATQLSPIRRWISGRAWCDGPIPARARRDAVCCSVRCRQARHRFLRTAGLPPGRKMLAGYREQGPCLSSHPALVRSTGSVELEINGVIADMEDQSPWMPGVSSRREVAVPLHLHVVERRKGQRR